jgi:hypothetical protein
MITEKQYKALCCNLKKALSNRLIAEPTADNYTVAKDVGLVVLNTGNAGDRDISLPNATLWKGRRIDVVNISGNAQTISSYDGTTAQIKSTSSAAAATLSLENASSTTTGRRSFRSNGTVWLLVSI